MQRAVGRICLCMAAAAGISVAVVGCSSQHSSDKAAVERREDAVKTVDHLRTDLKRADSQIITTQQALQRLSTQQAGDLKSTYDKFVDEVSRNRSLSESMEGKSRKLASTAGEHISQWDYSARALGNEQLRQTSISRSEQARQEQVQTLQGVNDVRAMYTRYIRQLDEIAAYTANDLTPRGVAGMHDQVQRTDQMAQDLRGQMAQVDLGLERMAASWQSDAPLAATATDRESAQPAGGTMPPSGTPATNP